MIKVMLINPPQKYFTKSMGFNVYFPLGLLYVASMIKNSSKVKIFDCLVRDFIIKKEGDYTIYGTPPEKIKAAIRKFSPDIVGVTIPFSTQESSARYISQLCKEVNPKIVVVFGGPHVSVNYGSLLQEGACDFCVIGEGEITFSEFVKQFHHRSSLENIEGLAYKVDSRIHFNQRKYIDNLDELPFPAYDLIDFKDYLKSKYLYKDRSYIHKNSISLITSRGCPFNCTFCSVKLQAGQKFRYHSPDYVIRHLKLCTEKYKITNFHFEDDNISLKPERFEQIMDEIIDANIGVKWDTPNGIRVDTLDFGLLKKIKKSGCQQLKISVESGSQEILDRVMKKNASLKKVLENVEYCYKLKIRLSAFYVIGLPGETIENMKETINLSLQLLRKYDVFPVIMLATPLYGTELYEECVKRGIIPEKMSEEELSNATQFYGNPLIYTEEFSKEDVRNLMRDFSYRLKRELVRYYCKHPIYLYESLKRVISNPILLKNFFDK